MPPPPDLLLQGPVGRKPYLVTLEERRPRVVYPIIHSNIKYNMYRIIYHISIILYMVHNIYNLHRIILHNNWSDVFQYYARRVICCRLYNITQYHIVYSIVTVPLLSPPSHPSNPGAAGQRGGGRLKIPTRSELI